MRVHAEIHLYSIHYVHQAGPPNMHGHTAGVSDCSNKPDFHLHRNASHSVNKLLNSLENSLSLSDQCPYSDNYPASLHILGSTVQ